jgi:hypothetical protein
LEAWEILSAEMEFLDINFTKDSSLLVHAISQSLLRILKKTRLFGFKNPDKKIRETRTLESIHKYQSVEQKNEGRKPDKTRV